MPYVLTLVAARPHKLAASHIARAQGHLEQLGIRLSDTKNPVWLAPHHAADIPLDDFPRPDQLAQIRDMFMADAIDVFATETAKRTKKLLLADMESTIIEQEILDELAALRGSGEQVADITAQAMNGELDFAAALNERLQLLAGTPEQDLTTLRNRLKFSPGAKTLVKTLAVHDVTCVLISGGFTFFTEHVAKAVGFHFHHGNVLTIEQGKVAGRMTPPLIDKAAKEQFLRDYALRLNIPLKLTAAIGDGANDLPMLEAAGLGVGYHPRPVLRERLNALILHGDLTALLYAMGYTTNDLCESPDV